MSEQTMLWSNKPNLCITQYTWAMSRKQALIFWSLVWCTTIPYNLLTLIVFHSSILVTSVTKCLAFNMCKIHTSFLNFWFVHKVFAFYLKLLHFNTLMIIDHKYHSSNMKPGTMNSASSKGAIYSYTTQSVVLRSS
jgi:hypothetical protein